jgi:hypothetical protein
MGSDNNVEKLLDMSLDEIIAAQGKKQASKPGKKPVRAPERGPVGSPERAGAPERRLLAPLPSPLPCAPLQVKAVKAGQKPAAGAGAKVRSWCRRPVQRAPPARARPPCCPPLQRLLTRARSTPPRPRAQIIKKKASAQAQGGAKPARPPAGAKLGVKKTALLKKRPVVIKQIANRQPAGAGKPGKQRPKPTAAPGGAPKVVTVTIKVGGGTGGGACVWRVVVV